jgi:ATP-dependent helicase/nuclease subunit A
MSDAERADRAARRAAQSVFDRALVLEAGAGTGKTNALVARVTAWCLGPGWERAGEQLDDPDRIAARVMQRVVAITFTEAAAAEMAERVAQALAELETGKLPEGFFADLLPEDETRRLRARHLLASLDQLVVRTIHAYCRRLLASHPLEAGLHPGFEVDGNGTLQAEVVREVIERRLRADWADGSDPSLVELARHELGAADLEQALTELLSSGLPLEVLDAETASPPRIEAFCSALRGHVEGFLRLAGERLDSVTRGSLGGEVAVALRQTVSMLEAPQPWSVAELEARVVGIQSLWAENRLRKLGEWRRRKFTKGEEEVLGSDEDELARLADPLLRMLRHVLRLRPVLLETLRQLLAPLAREVDAELRRRGSESYPALLRDTERLLERHPEVVARIRAEIEQIVVDEFQDTDSIQCNILRRLALAPPAESRPGLFLVGDPKQSIYGWRSADLEAYEALVEEVVADGGERQRLRVCFRSVPAILEEVERVMHPTMQQRPGLQPEFEPLIVCPKKRDAAGFRAGEHAPVEYWVSWRSVPGSGGLLPGRAIEAARVEARALAADLCRLAASGVRLGRVGLLFRSRGDLDIYLTELRARGIPYEVRGDRGYYQRREVIEAAALLRCIVDPGDHLSLLAWLRSASVGVPDCALLPLWLERLPERMTELARPDEESLAELEALVGRAVARLPGEIPGIERIDGWERSLLDGLRAVAELRESFESEAGDAFIERLRTRTLIEATESARHQGEYRIANLDRLFRRMAAELSDGRADPRAVLRALRLSISAASREEEGRPRDEHGDAVRVMTIHQAKGLDFEHVYLLQAHRGTRPGEDPAASCSDVDGLWEYQLLGVPSLGYAGVSERRREIAEAETVRTLYVALTRAKQRLVIAGSWRDSPGGASTGDRSTYLQLLQQRSAGVPELSELATRLQVEQAGSWSDACGARWVFPELRSAEDAAAGGIEPESGELPTAAMATRDAERLRAEREASGQRMTRTLGRAASAEAESRLGEPDEPDDPLSPRLPRHTARAVGTAVHQLLEELDLDGGADPTFDLSLLRGSVPEPDLEGALDAGRELLRRISDGPLLARLHELAPQVIARELPVLLPPRNAGDAALGYVEGIVDLVYRDAESGAYVVVDYKTDRVETPEELAKRVETYRPQIEEYARAVQGGLGLEAPPRLELWFLYPGRIEHL